MAASQNRFVLVLVYNEAVQKNDHGKVNILHIETIIISKVSNTVADLQN